MRQTLATRTGTPGGHALKFEYRTEPGDGKFYAAICIVKNWNLAGFDAVRFWLKPDGSGRELTIQWNVADAKGDNIHDLWQAGSRPREGRHDAAAGHHTLCPARAAGLARPRRQARVLRRPRT